MSYEEFRRRIDIMRQILVGAVPSPAGQIDQITHALMYKFMNDIDDQSTALGGVRTYFTGDYEKYNWHRLMDTSLGAHERLELYRNAIQTMAKNENIPELFRSIYQNAFLPFNSANVLNLFLKEADKFNHGEADDIGDAYEYLLSITGAQGDVGQFRTPRHIIKFIVEAVNPTKNDKVLDPAVGTAGFLIAAYNHVKSRHDGKGEQSNANDEKRLSADELERIHHNYRGFDIDPTMVRTAKVNMYLHNFKTPEIINHDSLSSEDYWNDRYDVIFANPPFMSPKGGIQPHKKFGISANRAEVLFVDYIASHLKPTGRAGIVVPEGIIFQSGKAYKELRKNLVENYLYAVVSLPAGVFQPYSGVKTSVLLFDKELAKERDEILFVKIENDGYNLGAQRRPIVGNQFPEALELIQEFKNGKDITSQLAHAVKREQIGESGDYNLSGDRYKATDVVLHKIWDIVKLEGVSTLIQRGKTPKYGSSNIQVIKSGQARGYHSFDFSIKYCVDPSFGVDHRKLQKGDILINSTGVGTAGRVTLFNLDGDYLVDGHITIVRVDQSKVLPTYVLYVLAEGYGFEKLESMARGNGGQIELGLSTIKSLQIPLPPIEIQREIVAELDGYQKIIDAAQTIVKTYQATIKINSEWERCKIGDVAKLMTGGTPSRSVDEYWENGTIPWLVSGDIHKGVITACEGRITQKALENSNARLLPRNSVMIALNGQGKTRATVALLAKEGFTCNQSLVSIKPEESKLDATFLYYQMKSMYRQIRNINGDNQRGGLNMSLIRDLSISIPPIEIQREIVAELGTEQKLIDGNKKLIGIFQQKIKSKIAEVWGK